MATEKGSGPSEPGTGEECPEMSDEQIESLILKFRPTMIFAEHDVRFGEKIATKTIDL